MHALALALLWWLASAWVARAEGPRVYVVARAADPALGAEAREVAALARFALAQAEGFQWQAADARVRGEEAPARAAQQRALAGLKRGQQAYLRFELEHAIGLLQQSLRDWEQALPVLDSPEPWAETLMYLGACHVLAGDSVRAAEVFHSYQVKFADLSPNAGVFNPEIMRQWDAAGHDLAVEGGGALEVRSSLPSAEVSVDARVRGTGRITVHGLAPGEHWVRVTAIGAQSFVGKAVVEPGRTARVDPPELEDSIELLDLLEHAHTQDGARVLLEELGVDALGVIEVRRGGTEGELDLTLRSFDAAGNVQGTFPRSLGHDFNERAAGVRGLVAAWLDRVLDELRPQLVATGGMATGTAAPQHSEARPAWYRRWWVWTIAGSVLAAGTLTTVLVVRNHGMESGQPMPRDKGTLVLQF
jgi:hypothetical protein